MGFSTMSAAEKYAVAAELDAIAGAVLLKLPGVPPENLAEWLRAQAHEAVLPYLQRGIDSAPLYFQFGLSVGQRLGAGVINASAN